MKLNGEVAAWYEEARKRLESEPFFDQIDLDHLLGARYLPGEAVALALGCYESLLGLSREISHEVMPMLAIPLGYSETLDTRSPSLSKLQNEVDEHHPPGLYLYRRELTAYLDYAEEYRVPLNQRRVRPKEGYVYCYYRTFRVGEHFHRQREYQRIIYFEYYPLSLIPPGFEKDRTTTNL